MICTNLMTNKQIKPLFLLHDQFHIINYCPSKSLRQPNRFLQSISPSHKSMTKQKVTWGPKYYMIYTVLNGFEYHATVDYIRHYEYRMMITKT